MLQDHLALAERHIDLGIERMIRQRQIVDQLRRQGCDIRAALEMLRWFEQLQASELSERQRLRLELASAVDERSC